MVKQHICLANKGKFYKIIQKNGAFNNVGQGLLKVKMEWQLDYVIEKERKSISGDQSR